MFYFVISTDIYKAFDSIDIEHMEKCLWFYGFPDEYVKAFMLLSRNGTVSLR